MRVRPTLALLMTASLAASETGAEQRPPSASLVGTWAYVDPQTAPRPSGICETDFAISYHADGTFDGYDQSGIWRLEGDDLVETIIETWEAHAVFDIHRVKNPVPSRARLQWVSADVVNITAPDGTGGYGLIRCRPYRSGR